MHTLAVWHGARFPGLVALLRHCHKDPSYRQDAKARRKRLDGTLWTSRRSTAGGLASSVPSVMLHTASPVDTISSRTRARPCARGAGAGSKQELSCQFGKRHGSPNCSGEIAAIFPGVLVANRSSAAGFGLVRSSLRFHSGPVVHPLLPAYRRLEREQAWRRMSAQRSLTLSRLILLPSPYLSAVLVLSLRKHATIWGSAPMFTLRHLRGRRSPILERDDEPPMPNQDSSQRKQRTIFALFQRRPPHPSGPRCYLQFMPRPSPPTPKNLYK
jgi:hypothetical protein